MIYIFSDKKYDILKEIDVLSWYLLFTNNGINKTIWIIWLKK